MKKLILILVCIGLLSLPLSVVASTSAEKQAAINAGLAYLAADQQPNGSWVNGFNNGNAGWYAAADTAAVLLAFVEQSYKPGGWQSNAPGNPSVDYSTVVSKGVNYLLSQASTLSFGNGNWWGFGAGSSGIQWNNNGEETYGSGLAITALSRLVYNPYGGSPRVDPSTPISGTGSSAVDGKTYLQVIQGAVDSFTYGQTGPGNNRYGGWRYFAAQGDSDMSTTQWAVISYLTAPPGVNIPGNGQDPGGNVKTALKAWLTADQYVNGGVGYQPDVWWLNATHSGGFLLSNYFAGGGGLGGDGKALALAYLNSIWAGFQPNIGWPDSNAGTNNVANPYAMWSVYKALETLYGTTGAGPILPGNLNPLTTSLDLGVIYNWWEDYCQWLVLNQNTGNGSWAGAGYWTGDLATAWDINILNATATIQPPGAVPEPATMILLGSGLVGLAGYARKRMKK